MISYMKYDKKQYSVGKPTQAVYCASVFNNACAHIMQL